MISEYTIPPLVIGIVLSELWLIHHFWLRQVFTPVEDNLRHQAADVGEKAARGVAMDVGLGVPQRSFRFWKEGTASPNR